MADVETKTKFEQDSEEAMATGCVPGRTFCDNDDRRYVVQDWGRMIYHPEHVLSIIFWPVDDPDELHVVVWKAFDRVYTMVNKNDPRWVNGS
jgi:hypothetical protein